MILSERIQRLEKRLKNKDYRMEKPWWFEKINILDIPENAKLREESIVIRKAYAMRYVAEHIPVVIYEDELVVGAPNQSSVEFGTCFPEYLTEKEKELLHTMGLSEYSLEGHHLPDWSRILKRGTQGLRKDIENALETLDKNNTLTGEKRDELRAMLLSLDALDNLAGRYADRLLAEAYECPDRKRKEELLRMRDICKRVPHEPAENLWESLQSYWFTWILLASNGEFLPLGTMDQYFYPFYQKDIASGVLKKEEATELMASFLIKCNERNVLDAKQFRSRRKRGGTCPRITTEEEWEAFSKKEEAHFYHEEEPEDSENNKFFGQEANNRMMTCVVGGMDKDGRDLTNDLSLLIVELIYDLKLLLPTLGARLHRRTSREFLMLLARVLRYGQGEPILYNDDAVFDGYRRLGIDGNETQGYSSDGCWETVLPGRTNFSYNMVWILQCLESVCNHGRSVKTGRVIGRDYGNLDRFPTYESLYAAFREQFFTKMEEIWSSYVESVGISTLAAPDPLLSVLCEGCIEKGEDFTGTGAEYQMRCILLTGFADTVDSLYAIKKVVYEEKRVSLEELNQALLSNWGGKYARLRTYIVQRLEGYGNDEEEVDGIGKRLLSDYSGKIKELRMRSDRILVTGGIGTFHMYAMWGNEIGASANGRYAYDALAPNYSPVPGKDKKGPLSVLLSSAKSDLSELITGTPVDLSVNANEFAGESGIERLSDLIRGFLDLRGQILTITSNSVEELKDAKLHPEKHRDLRVRMGGLSAYFIQLAPRAQDKIIERF